MALLLRYGEKYLRIPPNYQRIFTKFEVDDQLAEVLSNKIVAGQIELAMNILKVYLSTVGKVDRFEELQRQLLEIKKEEW